MSSTRSDPAAEAYTSTLDLATAAALFRGVEGTVLILTHAKPDGDALGAVVALSAALRGIGKPVEAALVPPVPANLRPMRGAERCRADGDPATLSEADPALVVVVDTGAYAQLGPLAEVVRPRTDRTLIIDHHLSGDIPAAHRVIDGGAAACCEMIATLIDHLHSGRAGRPQRGDGEPDRRDNPLMTAEVCDALFIGIASDTGWFRFSNTRPATHELAARLIRRGVDHAALYAQVQQTERPEKLRLLTRALDSLRLVADDRAAIMVLRQDDFAQTGAREEETEQLVDVPQQVESIRVVVLVTERAVPGPGEPRTITNLSFRSKPGPLAYNVAELAAQFGGGGHARAAGAKVDAPIDQVLERVTAAVVELIDR